MADRLPDPEMTMAGSLTGARFASDSNSGRSSSGDPGFGPVLEPGTILAGRYEVVDLLGQGGMGAVYKAIDREVERQVALKTIRPEMANNVDMLARFKQELVLARQITHRNVVRIYDLGEAAGVRFITMEYVDGVDLRTLLLENGKLEPGEAVEIMRQVCSALEAAHAEGVIHRDLKPQNIMRERSGRVVVMDFGLARTFESAMTQTGALVGTMEYMSPEQALGTEIDSRSDLFAIGLVFYELLTGKAPFKAETAIASLLKRAQERAIPASQVNAMVPRALSDVVARCLERDRKQRYQSASEILRDLEKWQAGGRTTGISRALPRMIRRSAGRRLWLSISAGVLALALIGGGIGLKLRNHASAKSQVTNAAPVLSLAIVPFRNASGDPKLDWLGSSLAEMLNTSVGESPQMHSVAPDRLHQILADLRIAPDSSLDEPMLQRIAQFSSADTMVYGKYMKFGESVQIEATLLDLKHERRVPLKITAAAEKDIPGAVDRLAASIRGNLAVSRDIVAELKAQSFKPNSNSMDALRDYNLGVQALREGKDLEALKSLQAAVAADPQFALAYSRMAEAQASLGYENDAEQASRKAVELARQVPLPERYLIQASHARIVKDRKKAVAAYENLARSAPDNQDILYALGSLYLDQGDFVKARTSFEKILQGDPKNIRALWQMGVVEIMSDNPQGALDPLNRALTAAVQADNQPQKGLVLLAMGISYRLLNKPDEALRNYKESAAINEKLGQKRGVAAAMNEMAVVQTTLGNPAAALASYTRALQLRREIGARKEAGDTLIDIGTLYQQRGESDKALQSYKEALQVQRDAGDENYQALCLSNIGGVYLAQGDTDNALTYLQQALQLRQRLNVPGDVAETVASLGEVYSSTGQYDDALNSFLQALDLWRKSGNVRGAASESLQIGRVYREQGRFAASINAMQDAVNGLRQSGDRSRTMVEALNDLAGVLAEAGRGNESGKLLDEAQGMARDLKNDSVQAALLDTHANVRFYAGELGAAKTLYEQAMRSAMRGTDKDLRVQLRLHLAALGVAAGRPQAVLNDLRTVISEAERPSLRTVAVDGHVTLAQALTAAGQHAPARQELERALGPSEKMGLRLQMARIHYLLGQTMHATGDSGATDQYRQAVSLLDEMRKEQGAGNLLQRKDLKAIYEDAASKIK